MRKSTKSDWRGIVFIAGLVGLVVLGASRSHADQDDMPGQTTPPKVLLNGKVEKVDGDKVQISIGTDLGLKKGQTLDIYRLKPAPKYLGMIRIVDANPGNSVGRLIRVGDAPAPVLREGDHVTSKLARDDN